MFAIQRLTYFLCYLHSQLDIHGFDILFQLLSGYLFRQSEGVFFIVIAIIWTSKDTRYGQGRGYCGTVSFPFSSTVQKHICFCSVLENSYHAISGVTVNACLGSGTHVAVGQKDGLLCSVHDCKSLLMPPFIPLPILVKNKSQNKHGNVFLLFDSPLFIAVPCYTPHSMPSHDCRRLFPIKYAQAKTKSQYIMCLKIIISDVNGSKLFPPLTITSYILNHSLRTHH